MMQSKKIVYMAVLAGLYGCSGVDESIPLVTVPETPTAVQTDLEDTDSDLQAARVEALKSRMKALQDDAQGQDPVPPAADIAPETVTETLGKLPAKPEPEPAFNPKPAQPPMRIAQPEITPAASYDVINPDMPATVTQAQPSKALEPIVLRQPQAKSPIVPPVMEVFFANNSSLIRAADRQQIAAKAAAFKDQDVMFLVEGYASPLKRSTTKGELINLRLSVARAQAVSDVMTSVGIDPARITIKGLSARNPRGFSEVKRRAVAWSVVPVAQPVLQNTGSTVLWPR
jgi:outer membrane protein OmpA-like peptidoglycan-associated protein